MFKNRPPICDIFGNPYRCWDKLWSIFSTERFIIPWKSQEKLLSINISQLYGGYVEIEKKQAQVWANLEGNLWRLTLRKKCPYSELFCSAFFPHFSAFGLNTGKMRTRITPNTDTFYAVSSYWRYFLHWNIKDGLFQ